MTLVDLSNDPPEYNLKKYFEICKKILIELPNCSILFAIFSNYPHHRKDAI